MRSVSRRFLSAGLAVSAIAAVACSSTAGPDGPEGAVAFQTDSAAYQLATGDEWYTTKIGATYTNRTSDTISFVNCQGIFSLTLEKFIDGAWTVVLDPPTPLCGSPPVAVPPGGQYHTIFALSAGIPGTNAGDQFPAGPISGVYRVRWDGMYSGSPQSADVPPEQERVSNDFVLTLPGS